MYSSIQIDGYRGLDSFSLSGLGRINLLVGANNSGKTSILECIELLQSEGSPEALYSILRRRGELAPWNGGDRWVPAVRHLFAGHDFGARELSIAGEWADGGHSACRQVKMRTYAESEASFLSEAYTRLADEEWVERTPLILHVEGQSESHDPIQMPMTSDGLLPKFFRARKPQPARPPASFLRAEGLDESDIDRYFQDIVLTDKEEHVVDALRAVEPSIERIAFLPYGIPRHDSQQRIGVYIRLANVDDRIPVGSMGDGLWRMLGLALALADSRGGILLVDEIDTGFHYSVMADMWRMVSERAEALSVQVFATTHSRDCYESLSAVATPERIAAGDVTIQRIERQRNKAIRFSSGAVVVAAERGLEVR